jgi:hypothetical protein
MSCVLEILSECELIERKKYLLYQIEKIDKQIDIIKKNSSNNFYQIDKQINKKNLQKDINKICIKKKSLEKNKKPTENNIISKNIKIKISIKNVI